MRDNRTLKSKYPRDVFNEIKWRFDALDRCSFCYIHRGRTRETSENVKEVSGKRIKDISNAFVILDTPFDEDVPYYMRRDVYIPYHRIIRIMLDDRTVFERRADR